MKNLTFLFFITAKISFAQIDCNNDFSGVDSLVVSDFPNETYRTSKNQYNPIILCADAFILISKPFENIKYVWFKSILTDTTSGDTIVRSSKTSKHSYLQCNQAPIPAYLGYRLLFDPDFQMEAVKAAEYIKENYANKGLIVTFYFKNADSIVTSLTRKFIYKYDFHCDFITGLENENNIDEHLVFFPNPSQNGIFNLTNSINTPKEVRIFTSDGREEIRIIKNNTLDLSNLGSGLYKLQYNSGTKKIYQKVIIE